VRSNPIMTSPGAPTTSSWELPAQINGRLSWSPDGDSIAFVDASTPNEFRLAVLDVGSRAIRTLYTVTSGNEWLSNANWNSDASELAFEYSPTRQAGGIDYRVWTRSSTTGLVHSVSPGRVDFAPDWSGDYLYFCRGTYDPPNVAELWRMQPGVPNSLEKLTSDPRTHKDEPAVRPGGDEVVYSGYGTTGDFFTSRSLYSLRPAAGGPQVLMGNPGWQDHAPQWSPDGLRLTFISTRSGHAEVWSLDHLSGEVRQLTRGPRSSARVLAARSPDGSRLAVLDGFQGGDGARGTLRVVELTP
jgi:Tol biopolymer transport system component